MNYKRLAIQLAKKVSGRYRVAAIVLDKHDKVKISMMFRGREIAFTEIGRKIMYDIKSELVNECVIDQEPRLEGRNMVMIVSPKK